MGAQEAEIPELNEDTKEMTSFIRGIYPGLAISDYMETGLVTTEEGNVIYDDNLCLLHTLRKRYWKWYAIAYRIYKLGHDSDSLHFGRRAHARSSFVFFN